MVQAIAAFPNRYLIDHYTTTTKYLDNEVVDQQREQ
jgi:hypothetical protein